MASRKEFVAAAAASVGALTASPAANAAAPTASPAPSPSPTPSPSARALAMQMRGFDPHLTDDEIETIASGIEPNLKLGNTINKHGRALKNSDEPVPSFEAQG